VNARLTEIQTLVASLNNLHEIFRVRAEILSHGEEIVEPLAGLLFSEPSTSRRGGRGFGRYGRR
jgi:hypothetical protein